MIDRLPILALSPLALALSSAPTWLSGSQDHAPATNLPDILPFQTGSDTSVTFKRSPDGMYRTIVHINGKPFEMIIDTGASRSVFSEAAASALGLRVSKQASGHIRTFSGAVPLILADIDVLQIAGRRFSHVQAAIIDGSDISVVGLDWLTLIGPVTLDG